MKLSPGCSFHSKAFHIPRRAQVGFKFCEVLQKFWRPKCFNFSWIWRPTVCGTKFSLLQLSTCRRYCHPHLCRCSWSSSIFLQLLALLSLLLSSTVALALAAVAVVANIVVVVVVVVVIVCCRRRRRLCQCRTPRTVIFNLISFPSNEESLNKSNRNFLRKIWNSDFEKRNSWKHF